MSDSSSNEWFDKIAREDLRIAEEQRQWYDQGLRDSADTFFTERLPWLAAANSVRVMTNADGHHDIVIRVDGTYDDLTEAQMIAALLQAKLYGHLYRIQTAPHLPDSDNDHD